MNVVTDRPAEAPVATLTADLLTPYPAPPTDTVPVNPAAPGFVAKDEDLTTPTERLLLARIKELEEIIEKDNLLINNYAKAHSELQEQFRLARAALTDRQDVDLVKPTGPVRITQEMLVRSVVAEMNKRDLSGRSEADRQAILNDRGME